MSTQSGLQQRWTNYRPTKAGWLWSCIGCVVATIAVGFFWGGWVTAGESTKIAARAADRARTEMAAAVCVSRFVSAPDAATQLATLRKADPWARTELLQKGGWTNVPGMKDDDQAILAAGNVGDICAQRLLTATLPASGANARL